MTSINQKAILLCTTVAIWIIILSRLHTINHEFLLDREESQRNDYSGQHQGKMLHFAVAGFEKCGTTTLMKSLAMHPQIYMGVKDSNNVKENYAIRKPGLKKFKRMYQNHINKTTPTTQLPIYNGFKHPTLLLSRTAMKNVIQHYSKTDFILTIRHPVSFFQSLYNFKYRNVKKSKRKNLPNPMTLIGDCRRCSLKKRCKRVPDRGRDVCTESAKFQYELSSLNLTPLKTKEELYLLDNIYQNNNEFKLYPGYDGKIFLSEIGQISDVNQTRLQGFTNGLEDFIGLESDTFHFRNRTGQNSNEKLIDICEEQYKPLRDVLVDMGTKAYKWIIAYLIKSDRVVVANRDHFIDLMEKWQYDPCMQT